MQTCRRRFLRLAAAAAGLPLAARMTAAQAYPTRPVRIIVPFTAGGPATVMAHVLAQPLSESWGQSFYVENLPTGASNVGSATAAKSPPDGYTLLVVTPSFVINPSLYAKLAYDPVRDFTPVILAVASPHVLLVNPSFPAKNVKELVALAKANPGKYSYASAGTGQSAQLAAELFKSAHATVQLLPAPQAMAPHSGCNDCEFARRQQRRNRKEQRQGDGAASRDEHRFGHEGIRLEVNIRRKHLLRNMLSAPTERDSTALAEGAEGLGRTSLPGIV